NEAVPSAADRIGPVTSSARRRAGRLTLGTGLVILVGLVGVAALASIAIRAKSMPWSHTFDALFHFDQTNEDHLIVRELRVPRTALALLVGAALGLAGAVMQGVTRNPLADP